MYILFDDFIQYSDAPESLKSAALADISTFQEVFISLDKIRTFDCIGVGNTSAESVIINGVNIPLDPSEKSGLYHLPFSITTSNIQISFPTSESVGRIAIGVGRKLGAAPAREPGFWTTSQNLVTLSGQSIPGVGGITGRSIQVDFRYKISREVFTDIQNAFPSQLGRGFPVFVSFPTPTEQNRFPWKRLYGVPDASWVFQSSVNFFSYSSKLRIKEAF